jgi:GDPmannose 4,6-dehydratase
MSNRTAIITGITGQDGSYLADLLLSKGYKVFGLKRRTSSGSLGYASHLANRVEIVDGDMEDLPSLLNLCNLAKADEFYNLAAQSHVGSSFKQPVYTSQVTGIGTLNCLEAIRQSGIHTRFYQASTSELFGGILGDVPLSETTPFHPRSPYGVAKLFAHWTTINYRESYKMFASTGILFNHESPRRGPEFVTRKITTAIAAIKNDKQAKVYLGNLDAKRDWGHARDYVRGMWQILQASQPGDFVLASGETHSVREFCEIAFNHAGLGDYKKYVEIDPKFYRPAEVHVLKGDSTKARTVLNWKPEISFENLVKEMVDADCTNASIVG